MDEYLGRNRSLWNGWTDIHERSDFYDIPGFLAGANRLKEIELNELGDISGKDLLHLQCHFGIDTLSLARLGARVTGVDFSERAIDLARSLADQSGIRADFVQANVYDVPEDWTNRFDIVYMSYGVLPWLPDLPRWAQVIARVLAPTGMFHLVEFHPVATMLDDDGRSFSFPYFHTSEPSRYDIVGSYADRSAPFTHESFEWSHSLGDVFTALISAGLQIRSFREFPFSPYNTWPFSKSASPAAGTCAARKSRFH